MELFYYLWNEVPSTDTSTEKIVLLHGMGGTGQLWRPIAVALEKEISILAPDQRGHGKSRAAQGGFSPLHYGQDVIDTLKAQNFYPTWILGHSMGVRTAVAAASIQPEWIKGLILVDLGFSGPAGGGLGSHLADFLQHLPLSFESREQAKVYMSQYCPDASIAQYLMAVSVKDTKGSISFPFSHSALIETLVQAQKSSIRPWIQNLANAKMPILAMRGALSRVWNREEFEKEKQLFISQKSVKFTEIEGAGHGVPFEQKGRFIEIVKNFISENK